MMVPHFLADAAPRLAARLARSPGALAEREGDPPQELDDVRRFVHDEILRVGADVVAGAIHAHEAGPRFADIAETAIAAAARAVEAELTASVGCLPGAAFAVIAMGKLGGRELTSTSDLDLVLVHDVPPGITVSEGPRPLPVHLYIARWAECFASALTMQVDDEPLYDVDLRLRPGGNGAPAVTSIDAFAAHRGEPWEDLSTTRARPVAGPAPLAAKVAAGIRRRLTQVPDADGVVSYAFEMRRRIALKLSDANPWNLKFARGGLVEIELLAQALQLAHAQRQPDILDASTLGAIDRLAAAGLLDHRDASTLRESVMLQQALTQALRIALDEPTEPAAAGPGVHRFVARVGGARDFPALELRLREAQAAAHAVFSRVITQEHDRK